VDVEPRGGPRSSANDSGHDEVGPGLKLRKPPTNDVGTPPPFAAAYADVLPEPHREALRDAAIT